MLYLCRSLIDCSLELHKLFKQKRENFRYGYKIKQVLAVCQWRDFSFLLWTIAYCYFNRVLSDLVHVFICFGARERVSFTLLVSFQTNLQDQSPFSNGAEVYITLSWNLSFVLDNGFNCNFIRNSLSHVNFCDFNSALTCQLSDQSKMGF